MAFRCNYLLLFFCFSLGCMAQSGSWPYFMRTTDAGVLTSPMACSVADSVVKYQMPCGGWPKNQNWVAGPNQEEMEQCRQTGIGATIDNEATWGELRFLARFMAQQKLKDNNPYRTAFLRGMDYLFRMQYDNGGFPQFYPPKSTEHYSRHITFNDNAMTNVLRLLRDISLGREPYASLGLPDSLRQKAAERYRLGVACVLDCQIRMGDTLTVWCQQHDERTLKPTKARAYELPSLCGEGETCDILMFLMEDESPSERLCHAVQAAVRWLRTHALHDVCLEIFTNDEGKPDKRLVSSPGAPLLWARFYDLETQRPFFCDRDGVPRPKLSDIGYERRNGYRWLGSQPLTVFEHYKDFARMHHLFDEKF